MKKIKVMHEKLQYSTQTHQGATRVALFTWAWAELPGLSCH